jgi:Fur family zinc uptake transcriptional regulator
MVAVDHDQAGGAARPVRGRNQQLVLEALRRAGRPLGAYELLRRLRGEGLRSPLQVYRALERLVAEGTVHRIESLGTYTPCSDAACGSDGHAVFVICTRCGSTSETHDPSLDRLLQRLARRQRFVTRSTTVELSGLCETCADA